MIRTARAVQTAALALALLAAHAPVRSQEAATPAEPGKIEALESAVRTLTAATGVQRAELEALRARLAERDSAVTAASNNLAARDAKIRSQGEELAAVGARLREAEQDAAAARAETATVAESQRALIEQAETVAASAAALELRVAEAEAALAERNAVLDRQRVELLAARNDLGSAEARLAGKDREVSALTTAARGLVAEGAAAAQALADRDRTLGELRTQLLAARNDLASADIRLAAKEKEVAALATAGRELVAGAEDLTAANEALEQRLTSETAPAEAFYGRLREALGNKPGMRIEGDRFIFPSDVAFVSGASRLTPAARARALELGRAIATAMAVLPADSGWVLRVDGHTDRQPVGGRLFASNRQLSAARALEVVEVLVEAGVPPERLAPAAFGEFRPLDTADTAEAYQANRRIELSLDEH
jgi:chemotaxis protein MotB